MDLTLILAGLTTGALTAATLTPEQLDALLTADPAAFTPEQISVVRSTVADVLRTVTAAEGFDRAAAAKISKALLAVDREANTRVEADNAIAEAQRLLEAQANPDGTPPEGGTPEGGEGAPQAQIPVGPDGLPIELPQENPAGTPNPQGTTASRRSSSWGADRFRMPFRGVTAAAPMTLGKERVSAGTPITNEAFFHDFARQMESVINTSGEVAFRPVGVVAKYDMPETDARRVSERHGDWTNQALIDGALEEQRIEEYKRPNGVTAAVWCGPVGVSFAIDVAGRGGRPIYDSLPKVPATRGQFYFRPDLAVGRTAASPPFVDWNPDTNTPDCAGFTCITPSCETTQQLVQLWFLRACFEHTNTHELTDPEGLAAVQRKNMIQMDRWLEQKYMASLQLDALTSGTYFKWDSETTYGAIPDIINLLFGAASEVGWDGRYERGAYVAYVPEGLEDWMFVDETASAYQTSGAAQFTEALRRRQISVVEYLDDPVLGRNPLAGPVYNQPAGGTLTSTSTQSVTTASSSTTLVVTSSTGMYPGMSVSGTGIPASTTIVSITDATHIVMSAAATASASVTGTFTGALTASQPSLVKNPIGGSAFRVFLVPKGGVPVAETGRLEIGPDRVTNAKCDIVRTVMTLREAMFHKDPNRPVFSIDVKVKFNGARAGAVTPW